MFSQTSHKRDAFVIRCKSVSYFFAHKAQKNSRGPPLKFGSQPNFRQTEDYILKKKLIRSMPGYEEFKKECTFEKCEDEYPGWTGKEKYIVFSKLSRKDLERKYPEITQYISPYILIDASVSAALVEYKRNEDKHHWRSVHYENGFGLDELTETIHPEMLVNDIEESAMLQILLDHAMSQLTDAQRRRVRLRYFEGLTIAQIAKIEKTVDSTVFESITVALKKMKKYLDQPE